MRHTSYFLEIELREVLELVAQNKIVDISSGGLIVGNRHSNDGIKLIHEDIATGKYGIIGEMEGGEFVMNCFATDQFYSRIEEINSYYNTFEGIDVEIPGIRQHIIPDGHFAIMSACQQAIINRAATQKYLAELVEMNEKAASNIEAWQ